MKKNKAVLQALERLEQQQAGVTPCRGMKQALKELLIDNRVVLIVSFILGLIIGLYLIK